ncbi:hypothetical protein BD309DRAFT_1013335 [Dichomitus squalens]|nr:hypothetical protein BD309DRAFT_1013335 [Dichomitus squalens]
MLLYAGMTSQTSREVDSGVRKAAVQTWTQNPKCVATALAEPGTSPGPVFGPSVRASEWPETVAVAVDPSELDSDSELAVSSPSLRCPLLFKSAPRIDYLKPPSCHVLPVRPVLRSVRGDRLLVIVAGTAWVDSGYNLPQNVVAIPYPVLLFIDCCSQQHQEKITCLERAIDSPETD